MAGQLDCELRRQAASVIRRFRDCNLTNDQFEDAFRPILERSRERSLKAVKTAIWSLYDDTREHLLADGGELQPEVQNFLDRCILFLNSDLPYGWQRDNFISIPLFELIRNFANCLSRYYTKSHFHFPSVLRLGPESNEDWSVWPFLSHEDLARASALKEN